jgi:hydantoinase/carbamoylase family amidase
MASAAATIDRARSAERIERDIEALAGPDYTRSSEAIQRYAYIPEYRATLEYFERELQAIGFDIAYDPVGTLVARNRPAGEPAFGIGSHCDSNRNGGKYDGTMGVVTALEVCRLNAELGLDLPLQLVSWLEEEGSGFGQMLLGSRIAIQRVTEQELREEFRALDDGRSFWEHAEEAGYEPARWQESIRILDNLTGWIELHIEQARVLQDTGNRIGIVNAIAGYVHADIWLEGRADHAGATPMDFRLDAGPAAARVMLEVERLAREAGGGTVATVGEIELEPGLINVVPGKARLSLDTRGVDEARFRAVSKAVESFAQQIAAETGLGVIYRQRQTLSATPMDERIVGALEAAAEASGEPFRTMPSGAAHDTMCVADVLPTAMVFVPCRDGISHSPDEHAEPADAALGAGIILNAIRSIVRA